jgi:hypothetical protein
MQKDTINYQLSDKDFSRLLFKVRDPQQALEYGFAYFATHQLGYFDAIVTTAVLYNKIASLIEASPSADLDTDLSDAEFAAYLEGVGDTQQKLADAVEWVTLASVGLDGMPAVITHLLDAAKTMLPGVED